MSILELPDASLCVRLAATLGHFLWQGAAVYLLVILAAVVLRRSSAGARYVVFSAALLVMAACPAVTFVVLRPPETPAISGGGQSPPYVLPEMTLAPPEAPPPTIDYMPEAIVPPPSEQVSLALPPEPAVEAIDWWYYAPWLVACYLCGAVLMFGRLLMALCGGQRLRRRSEPVDDSAILAAFARQARALGLRFTPAIAFCRDVAVPTVVGAIRPMILLPLSAVSGLTTEQIEVLLAHELAHIRRYDHLVNILQRLIEAVLFFHPAVWFISRRIRIERENCCDDLVLAVGGQRFAYAESLVRMAELSRAGGQSPPYMVAAVGADGHNSQLGGRILRIIGAGGHEQIRLTRLRGLAVCLLTLVVVAACVRLSQTDQTNRTEGLGDQATTSLTTQPAAETRPTESEYTLTQGDWTLTVWPSGVVGALNNRNVRGLDQFDAIGGLSLDLWDEGSAWAARPESGWTSDCSQPASVKREGDTLVFEYPNKANGQLRVRCSITFTTTDRKPVLLRTVTVIPNNPPFRADFGIRLGINAHPTGFFNVFAPRVDGVSETSTDPLGRTWVYQRGSRDPERSEADRLAIPMVSLSDAKGTIRVTHVADPSFTTAFHLERIPNMSSGVGSGLTYVWEGTKTPLTEPFTRKFWTVIHDGPSERAMDMWRATSLADVPAGVSDAEHRNDLETYLRVGMPLSYPKVRRDLGPKDLSRLHAMLQDPSEMARWGKAARLIGYLSDDQASVPLIIAYVRRSEDVAHTLREKDNCRQAIMSKLLACEGLGFLGSPDADRFLRHAFSVQGAEELVSGWQAGGDVLKSFKQDRQDLIGLVRGWVAVGLVSTKSPENIRLVEDLYRTEHAECEKSRVSTQLHSGLVSALAIRDAIIELGFYPGQWHESERDIGMSPYFEKYRVSRQSGPQWPVPQERKAEHKAGAIRDDSFVGREVSCQGVIRDSKIELWKRGEGGDFILEDGSGRVLVYCASDVDPGSQPGVPNVRCAGFRQPTELRDGDTVLVEGKLRKNPGDRANARPEMREPFYYVIVGDEITLLRPASRPAAGGR